MHRGFQVILLLAFLGLCVVLAAYWPADSGQWASWIQAFGSIGAILIAVWVSHRDNVNASKREREAELEEGRRVIKALMTELAVCWDNYNSIAGRAIEAHEIGTPFRSYWLPPEDPFPMFLAYAGRMHLIICPQLRQNIIHAYASMRTMFIAYKTNNLAMEELNNINTLIVQEIKGASDLGGSILARMSRYSGSIRNSHDRAKVAVSKVFSGENVEADRPISAA